MFGNSGFFSRLRDGGSNDISIAQRLAFTFCMLAMLGTWVAVLGLALVIK